MCATSYFDGINSFKGNDWQYLNFQDKTRGLDLGAQLVTYQYQGSFYDEQFS
jgi:hypothetical protein